MKKLYAAIISLAMILCISFVTPANADITSVTWIKPAWKNKTGANADPFLGDVSVAYIENTTWILNILVNNNAGETIVVKNIAVWFDWNKFYNTTTNVTITSNGEYLFTINGTTESAQIASNLFTHRYKIYVDFEYTTVSRNGTWTYPRVGFAEDFAVLTQKQYDAAQASGEYAYLKGKVSSLVDDHAESYSLYIQAETEANTALYYYTQGEFNSSLQHYQTAINLLKQAWTIYVGIESEYDENQLNKDKAATEKQQAEANAINANATAKLIEANGLAQAMVINATALAIFGLGFMFFGVAAIVYAWRKPKTPAQA
jgi:tetratricopeptide (TPR) repeat protein